MMRAQKRKATQPDDLEQHPADVDSSSAALLAASDVPAAASLLHNPDHPGHVQLGRDVPDRALGTNTCALSLALILSLLLSAWLVFVVPFTSNDPCRDPLGDSRPSEPGYAPTNASQITVGTFNVRFSPRSFLDASSFSSPSLATSDGGWGEQPWRVRYPHIVDQVIWNELDIVAFQEVLYHQLRDLDDALGHAYAHRGVGRDDGHTKGEAVPVFWRRDRFDFVSVRHSWLSKHPDVPGSIDWDAGQTRMVTMVHLTERETKQDVYILNTHWDDKGIESRTKAAELILDLVGDIADSQQEALVVLLGDLNSPPEEEGYQTLTGHRYKSRSSAAHASFLDSRHELVTGRSGSRSGQLRLSSPYGQYNTFTGFRPSDTPAVIDVALLHSTSSPAWTVDRYGVVPNLVENDKGYFLISDHRLVVARFSKQ